MALPIIKNENQDFQLMQSKWSSELNPLLANPMSVGHLLSSVPLVSGSNVVNHGLGSKLQGWMTVRRRQWLSSGTPTVYDVSDIQDSNGMPGLTLTLYCTQGTLSNPVLIDLWVY